MASRLQRRKPLKKRSEPLKRNSTPVRKTPKKKVTEKRKSQLIEYSKLRVQFLSQHKYCAVKLPGCTILATEIHHQKGRENYLLLDTQYWLPVCRSCHNTITEHSKLAIEKGFSISRHKKHR
jgi:hypothetical protein